MNTERFAERRLERQIKSDTKNYGALLTSGMNCYIHDTDSTYSGYLLRLTLDDDGKVIRTRLKRPGTSLCIQPAIIS